VAVEAEGSTLLVSTGDVKMQKFFAARRRTELKVLRQALDTLREAAVPVSFSTFVDAGAYIGTATFAALVAGFNRALACEPSPENIRLLRMNLALNGAGGRVDVVEAALSNHSGSALLDLGRTGGAARIIEQPEGPNPARSADIRCVRLDDLVHEGLLDPALVGLLWLDVEGHELHALEGAEAVLSSAPPIVMELHPEFLRRAGSIDRLPEFLADRYTHVADVRHRGPLLPIGEIRALVREYERKQTDVLVCRLPGSARRGDSLQAGSG
jgi:FkbM family methyltransferase